MGKSLRLLSIPSDAKTQPNHLWRFELWRIGRKTKLEVNVGTWSTITQTGTRDWLVWNQNITNHEAFAFTLQVANFNVGALISNITVFMTNTEGGGYQTPTYFITLQAMQFIVNPDGSWSLKPVNETISGNFESNGV